MTIRGGRLLSIGLLFSLLAAWLPAAALAAPLRALVSTIVDNSADVGIDSSLVLDASGNAVISYFDVDNTALKLAHCNDAACSAPLLTTVDNSGTLGSHSSLALDSAGNPVISYYDAGNFDLKLAHCHDPNCASGTLTTVDGGPGDVGEFTSLVLDSAGNPVISYFDESNDQLKLAHCNDPNCASATINTVDPSFNVGQYTSLALDSAGNPVISYYDPVNDNFKLAHCNDPNCASAALNPVDISPNNTGQYNSLALDSAGNPVISYYDDLNDSLKLAHCNDPDCLSTTINIVDNSSPNVGQYTSLVLDSAGNPVISYRDVTNSSLKLAQCNDPDCASATLTTVDNSGNVGFHTSLALDCAGNPVISYYDLTSAALRLVSDNSTNCGSSGPSGGASASNTPSASKAITSSGVTSLHLGRIIVSVPASAIPSGQTGCSLTITETGESGAFGFMLDDTVWDVKVLCNGSQVDIFFDALTICIQPVDGVINNKNVYHSHNGGSFSALAGGELPGYVCGQTRLLSLFTLGQLTLPATGFAPGVVTQLGEQPSELAYVSSNLLLSIPKLGAHLDIVGVPQGPNGWDVSWLSSGQAGYLYGTSYPTWQGNSVLTAHVWNADNTPGPFYGLSSLQHGDRFTVVYDGSSYTYEVRSNQLVLPSSLRPLADSDYSLITLITCESFDDGTGEYRYRRAVQAVLISVQ